MLTATVTSKGQITIPKEIRDARIYIPAIAWTSFSKMADFMCNRQMWMCNHFQGCSTNRTESPLPWMKWKPIFPIT